MERIIINEQVAIGGNERFVLIAGPCVVEDQQGTRDIAR